jgi:hypothetical protein
MNWRTSHTTRLRFSGTFVALLYVVFGLGDMFCSLGAFALGFPEANPVLAWMAAHGLFVPAKLALTALAAWLIVALYNHTRAQAVAWAGVIVMALVNVYHLVHLRALV